MATYHIDFLNGSNVTGDGTALSPWATITHIFSEVTIAAGDTIKVATTGTETDIDTAATFSNINSITTSIDLTADLAVGDLFIVSPKIATAPELDGWMICEVLTITSDTITTTNLNNFTTVFPSTTAGNVTITKIGAFVNAGSSGNFEDFIAAGATNAVLKDVIFEAGYDPTFTTVTGLTNIFRTGLGFNTSVGTVFTSCSSSSQLMPLMKNFRFSKFLQTVGGYQFSSRPNMQNCHFFTVDGMSRGGGNFWGSTQTINIYLCNTGNNFTVGADDYTNIINVFNVTNQRFITLSHCVGDITIVNHSKTSNGSYGGSGFAASFATATRNMWQKGKLTYTTSTWPSSSRNILFRTTTDMSFMDITSVNLINSNATVKYPYIIAAADTTQTSNLLINLPTGVALEDLGHFTGGQNAAGSSQNFFFSTYNIVDGDGVNWTLYSMNQLAVSTDTTEFVTGSSSRKVKIGFNSLAAAGRAGLPIGKFKKINAGLTLQSVTIKAKKSSNVASVTTQLGTLGDNTAGNIITINTDTFTDYTYTLDASLDLNSNPNVEQLLWLGIQPLDSTTTTADSYLWIDSVTFNYA
jgi:hypothetical protein